VPASPDASRSPATARRVAGTLSLPPEGEMAQRTSFDEALRQIDDWIGPQGVGGAAAVVWHGGGIAAERYAGEARAGAPVDERTIFALASVTKPVTAATVLTLVEDGSLALDEPIYRFVPEFAPAADAPNADPDLETRRREVTIRHLLSHTSGLPEDLASGTLRYRDRPELATITDAMARLPLRTVPGTQLLYPNAGFALLGRLVERVTGGEFWEEPRRRVLAPLALDAPAARPEADIEDRLALVADANHAGSEVETY